MDPRDVLDHESLRGGMTVYAYSVIGDYAQASELFDGAVSEFLDGGDGVAGRQYPAVLFTNLIIDKVRHWVSTRIEKLWSDTRLLDVATNEVREETERFIEDPDEELGIASSLAVIKAIEELDNDLCRAVLIWEFWGGKSSRQIATLLGCNKRVARKILWEARRELAATLGDIVAN
ncbi:MAG: hypothetical protein WEB04_11210 [Dehalococcoidia bacterium]